VSWLHNNLVLPMFEPERHRGLGRRLRAFERFDASSRSEQIESQAQSVRRLLEHAYRTTPHYRRVFDDVGFRYTDWNAGESIPLPILSREELRTRNDELRSRRFPMEQLRAGRTGGTTSTPVQLFRDIEGLRNKTALQFHLNRMAGFDQGDSVLLIWGAERDLALNPSWRWKLYEQTLMHRYTAAAGQISEAVFESFHEKLNRHRPKVLYGYSATTARFAEYLTARSLPHHNPEKIILTAEPLSADDRKIIEDTFGCKATEHYGSRDIGMVASQCEHHQGLHFHPAGCYMELIEAGRTPEGPMYRLLITDLLNYGMPLIRYDTEDCVLLEDSLCPCGRRFPAIKSILGRTLDNFILADGTQIPGIAITVVMAKIGRGFQHVNQVQLIQKETDHLEVRYAAVGDELAIAQELAKFREGVEELFKMKLRWTETRVPEILREQSGKLRLCISEVRRDQLQSA
jgi:phenylacetate-CoA ligase